jgi:lipase maturation factor 1
MLRLLSDAANWLLGPEKPREGGSAHLWARWIFLRWLGFIYFSAFYALLFQIKGLIGPDGLLPASDYLRAVAQAFPHSKYDFAPTLFWLASNDRALMAVMWVGLIASMLVFLNLWPRASLLVCFLCFVSFVSAAQDFSGYQSDGMLLAAGFISLFFAPPGLRPGLGRAHPASRASLFLLRWEWFRIYFESGVAKWMGGDPSWRNFTAMDRYYQNGPLPTWIGWYVQHLPHWFQAFSTGLTLVMELFIVWMMFLPRRFRVVCFWIVTPFQIGIILTANYTFLNYIVLALGFLLLDDRSVEWIVPGKVRRLIDRASEARGPQAAPAMDWRVRWRKWFAPARMAVAGLCLAVVLFVTTGKLFEELAPLTFRLPEYPAAWIEQFRIANDYHLFGTMTPNREEIEFQGTRDGKTWIPYKFRYKPQDLNKPPGIYAPYQPRFDWNLWFASLGSWPEYKFVVFTEERLAENDPDVLALFAGNPFPGAPPIEVRTVIYQYWFTSMETKRETGNWWRRQLLGQYAPALEREPDGSIQLLPITSMPIQNGETSP